MNDLNNEITTEPVFNLEGTKYPQAYGYGYLTSLVENVVRNAEMARQFPQSADYYIGEIIKAKKTLSALRQAIDAAN